MAALTSAPFGGPDPDNPRMKSETAMASHQRDLPENQRTDQHVFVVEDHRKPALPVGRTMLDVDIICVNASSPRCTYKVRPAGSWVYPAPGGGYGCKRCIHGRDHKRDIPPEVDAAKERAMIKISTFRQPMSCLVCREVIPAGEPVRWGRWYAFGHPSCGDLPR